MNEAIAVSDTAQTLLHSLDEDEAATLEDSDLLVLSKRNRADCRSDCPHSTPGLDNSLQKPTLSSDSGAKAAAQSRAWSRFRRSGLPMIVLVGGCAGTGKSTVAAELARQLDIGRIQSTDILRDVVRLFVPEQLAPELHVSSYDAWRVSHRCDINDSDQDSNLIAGFCAQSAKLSATIDAVIQRSIKEGASIIIEGIHVNPDCHPHLRLFHYWMYIKFWLALDH